MIGPMAFSGPDWLPEYVDLAPFLVAAGFGAWRLGRYLRSLPPWHAVSQAAPGILAVLYFACGISLGAGGAAAAVEGVAAQCGDPRLLEALGAARRGFGGLAVLAGAALLSLPAAWRKGHWSAFGL